MEMDRDVDVTVGGASGRWRFRAAVDGGAWRLELLSEDRVWEAEGPDAFEALRNLRRQLDPLGVRLGCNGARVNAWSSGMQRDMGLGRATYLCRLGSFGKPEMARTLDPAPPSEVGTVAEQDEFHEAWLADRRNAPK